GGWPRRGAGVHLRQYRRVRAVPEHVRPDLVSEEDAQRVGRGDSRGCGAGAGRPAPRRGTSAFDRVPPPARGGGPAGPPLRRPMRTSTKQALAFWLREPGVGEIRPVPVCEPAADEVLVRTLFSGVSRGTEALVFRGAVPPSEYDTMRAPFQEGNFPGPVKYGYLNVGVVEDGPAELRGHAVFCLY